MVDWYCAERHLLIDPDSGPFHCEAHISNEGCRSMRLVRDDSIVVERGVDEHEGEWPEWALRTADYESNDSGGEAQRILDGLARGFFSF